MAAKKSTIRVRQTGSAIRRPDVQRKILTGLGLGRIGKEKELEDTPAIRGMIAKVAHMVEVIEG
ncbi:MAG: 50S ribosomal protein L30 [Alphaproteobacteria bacterium]|nr:50S ribosomal protein L30 [Alphaproteobacteria bacterium]